MSIPFRALLAAALLWLAVVFMRQAQHQRTETADDGSRIILLFTGMVTSGLVAAGLIVSSLLPKVGESVGNLLFNPGEQQDEHPHHNAITAMARGDYRKAVDEYERIIEKDPEDTLAYSEAARVLCDKLHDCDGAVALLEGALDREWAPEDAAFISLRLADVYWLHQNDLGRARGLLLQIMETVPDTKNAATAAHKLHELDRKLMMQG